MTPFAAVTPSLGVTPFAALPAPTPVATASVSTVTPPPVDKTGVGGLGFLIVCALLAASVGLYFAMRGSLRRLQQRDLDGSFGGGPIPTDVVPPTVVVPPTAAPQDPPAV